MRKFTTEEFLDFLKTDGWTREQYITEQCEGEYPVDMPDLSAKEYRIIDHMVKMGSAIGEKVSVKDGVKVVYRESVNWDLYEIESFELTADLQPDLAGLEIHGAELIGENDGVYTRYIVDIFDNDKRVLPEEFKNIDYSELKASIEKVDETDLVPGTEKSDEIFLTRFNAPNVRFTGRLLGQIREELTTGKYRIFKVFEKENGGVIAYGAFVSDWIGDEDFAFLEHFYGPTEAREFFGESDLADELYRKVARTTSCYC